MGGLRKFMPVTFADLRGRHAGAVRLPAVLLRFLEQGRNSARRAWLERLAGAVLSGRLRRAAHGVLHDAPGVLRLLRQDCGHGCHVEHLPHTMEATHATPPHESPAVMTVPLVILAVFAVLLGFVGTPAWPWFQAFLERQVCDRSTLPDSPSRACSPIMISSSHRGLSRAWPGLVFLRTQADRQRRSAGCAGTAAAAHLHACSSMPSTSTNSTTRP